MSVCAICITVFYIYVSLSKTVSDYRREMNSSAYSAQLFLGKNELLLRLKAVSMAQARYRLPHADSQSPQTEGSGVDPRHSSMPMLTPYELEELRRNQAQLIYTPANDDPTIQVLAPVHSEGLGLTVRTQRWIAQNLAQAARERKPQFPAPMVWLTLVNDEEERLFIYTPLDATDPAAGWLGLVLNGMGTRLGLHGLQGGHYVLSDSMGYAMLANRHAAADEPGKRLLHAPRVSVDNGAGDVFDLIGDGLIPEFLLLHKSVGEAGWFLNYYMPLRQLLKDNARKLQVATVLCLAFVVALLLFVRLVRRMLLVPALAQQAALQDSEALTRKLIETVPAGLAVIRCTDRQLLLSNGMARRWMESDPSWFEHACEDTSMQGLRELVLHGNWVVQVSSRLTVYGAEPVVLCMISDVSALKQIQQSLLEAKLRAESASQAKTLFLATMSHEIRTPLYGILGTLELLSLSRVPGEQMRYLETMQQASATLLRVVNDSLDLSAIEAGHLKLEAAPFSAIELLDNVVAGFISRAEKKGLQIYSVADVTTPSLLLGDALRLRQILDNLVGNAVKFTTSGHICIGLKVNRFEGDRVDLRFEVRDTGIGIAPEQQPYLFDPYFRVPTDLSQQVQGTGLGLSICSRLARQMGGHLTAVSEPGLGTCIVFELALPVSRQAGTAQEPRLAPEPVYVDGAIAEVVDNLCEWLRRWGAMAHPCRDPAPQTSGQAILVEAWPRSPRRLAWSGKRVVALAPGSTPQAGRQAGVWEAATCGVPGVVQALRQAQRGVAMGTASAAGISQVQGHERMGLRVLIVEDNPINQLILREQLLLLGCEVQQASNGQDALSVPDLPGFDVVITDLHMPLLDGFGLAQALRQRGFEKPIIGLTANAYPQEVASGRNTGIDSLLCKPFSLSLLRMTLNKIKEARS